MNIVKSDTWIDGHQPSHLVDIKLANGDIEVGTNVLAIAIAVVADHCDPETAHRILSELGVVSHADRVVAA